MYHVQKGSVLEQVEDRAAAGTQRVPG